MSFGIQRGMGRTWSIIIRRLYVGLLTGNINFAMKEAIPVHCYVCSRSRSFTSSVLHRCMTGSVLNEWRACLKLEGATDKDKSNTPLRGFYGHLKQISMHTQELVRIPAAHRNSSWKNVRMVFIHHFPNTRSPGDECVTVLTHLTNIVPPVLMFTIHYSAKPSVHILPFVNRTEMCVWFQDEEHKRLHASIGDSFTCG